MFTIRLSASEMLAKLALLCLNAAKAISPTIAAVHTPKSGF